MFRSIVHQKDFEVSLYYESEDLMPPGVSSPIFAHYTVSGLANATERCELVLYVADADLEYSVYNTEFFCCFLLF